MDKPYHEIKLEHLKNLRDMEYFCETHSEIYVWCEDKCGVAINKYLHLCDIKVAGFASETNERFVNAVVNKKSTARKLFPSSKVGVILSVYDMEQQKALYALASMGIKSKDVFLLQNDVKGMIELRMSTANQLRIGVQVIDYCNLNCKGCNKFSPVAKKDDGSLKDDFDEYARDIKRLAQLCTKDNFDELIFTGGEPTLNPFLVEYMRETRKNLQHVKLKLATNGIKLLSMNSDFWKTLLDCDVEILMTEYPINIDLNAIKKTINDYGIAVNYFRESGEKTTWKFPYDMKGKQSKMEFIYCWMWNHCAMMYKGRLYPCSPIPSIRILAEHFKHKLPSYKQFGINIYEADNAQQLLDFVASRSEFCKYCNLERRSVGHLWEISKKCESEWI